MTSFETISLDDYKKLVDNEKKIFDLTDNFTSPEILNKYRHTDENIDKKIKQKEKIKEKYDNLDKIINKGLDKIKEKSIKNITNNYYSNDNDEVEDDKYMEYINKEMNDDIMSKIYEQNYRFNDDEEILDSFSKIFKEYDMEYNPRPNTRYYRVRYLLNKIKGNIPVDLYNYFHTTLSENNKAYHIIPIDKNEQTGSSINNIIINDKDLNKGILRVRYLNNRKLTNDLLKQDYKISKNMVNAIKFNKNIHKLSKNEMKIYHELQKFLNKEQDINVLIGSYLSGNNSKNLYNKISSMLYNKLKNGMINKKEYTKLINKINKI